MFDKIAYYRRILAYFDKYKALDGQIGHPMLMFSKLIGWNSLLLWINCFWISYSLQQI